MVKSKIIMTTQEIIQVTTMINIVIINLIIKIRKSLSIDKPIVAKVVRRLEYVPSGNGKVAFSLGPIFNNFKHFKKVLKDYIIQYGLR